LHPPAQRHASRDKSFQAFPLLFVLQATKAGHGGLGMRLPAHAYSYSNSYNLQFSPINAHITVGVTHCKGQ